MEDYMKIVANNFNFPTLTLDNLEACLDWMTDLSWLNKEGFVLIINNYKDFLKNHKSMKKTILNLFTDVILPFWQNEVEQVVVEGKARPFTVYLVE